MKIVWHPFPAKKPEEISDGYLVTRELSDGTRIVHEAFWATWKDRGGIVERWEAGGDGYPEFKDVIAFTDWKPKPYATTALDKVKEGE